MVWDESQSSSAATPHAHASTARTVNYVPRGATVAHETINHQDRIVHDPAVMVGKPVVKGTRISVEHILAALAVDPDPEALYRSHPELTRDDIRAVFAYAHDRIQADDEPSQPVSNVSPWEFYASITQRPDVAEFMRRLAR
jgi:uncharacterized protein (DUF433 family)